jgi:hypothetical protein
METFSKSLQKDLERWLRQSIIDCLEKLKRGIMVSIRLTYICP